MRARRAVVVLMWVLILGLTPVGARATLITVDLSAPGDGLVTRDAATGLEWLDLTLTVNVSYDAVAAGFGSYTTAHGFRFANTVETTSLFASAGLTPVSGTSDAPASVAAVTSFLGLLGCTQSCTTSPTLRGHADLPNFSATVATIPTATLATTTIASWDADGVGGVGKSTARAGVGAWLVRQALPVPEPSTLVLLLAGLGTLGACSARRAG